MTMQRTPRSPQSGETAVRAAALVVVAAAAGPLALSAPPTLPAPDATGVSAFSAAPDSEGYLPIWAVSGSFSHPESLMGFERPRDPAKWSPWHPVIAGKLINFRKIPALGGGE